MTEKEHIIPIQKNKHGHLYTEEDTSSQKDEESEGDTNKKEKIGVRIITIIVLMALLNVLFGIMMSILAPFYPQMGTQKGLLVVQTGLVIGVYGLMAFITAPVIGNYTKKIGVKFLFNASTISEGFCFALFGILELCPPGTIFFVMSLIIRAMEGILLGAWATAELTIMTNMFPVYATTFVAISEACTTVGEMIGPFVGGVLYQFGGFKLPFLTTGVVAFVIGILVAILMRGQKVYQNEEAQTITVPTLLKSARIVMFLSLLTISNLCVAGLMSVAALYIRRAYGVTEILIGLTYLPGSAGYALATLFWGYIGDVKPTIGRYIVITGYVIGGVILWTICPAPFITINRNPYWIWWILLPLYGVSLSTAVLIFPEISAVARDLGVKGDVDSNSSVCGLFNGSFYLGAFLGPFLCGGLMDKVGFRWATTIVGCILMISAFVLVIYTGIEKWLERKKDKVEEELKPIQDNN